MACTALPGAAAERLASITERLALGVDPERVWATLAEDAELAPLGRALARAHRTGAPIVAAVERLARENGAQSIELVTADANVAGLDLFLRGGFERVRRLKKYYPRGQDAQRLRKRV